MSGTRFGLLTYPTSHNLGDEIQSVAARRWLPRTDLLVSREGLDRDPDPKSDRVAMILNGWFLHRPAHWPPHPRIAPVITSFHLSQDKPQGRWARWRKPIADAVLKGDGLRYLRRNGPVGARDPATLALLRNVGVDAYYSGCLTLTLDRDAAAGRTQAIVACDLSDAAAEALGRQTRRSIVRTTHHDAATRDPHARLAAADALLSAYGRAAAVVTTRLHCALPCLALGTPVLFVAPPAASARLAPALQLSRHCTMADLLAGTHGFDLDAPPPNPDAHLPLRDALKRHMAGAFDALG